jgi:hypothetical protein
LQDELAASVQDKEIDPQADRDDVDQKQHREKAFEAPRFLSQAGSDHRGLCGAIGGNASLLGVRHLKSPIPK